ncbi:hypothetical protein SARC_02665 [Sphaeroforma arctica JP610]|uniref:Uncharacterized protein n=1 Tax=Sphaeroforma arctica JP610 TaxID=667725 RepID=A0A0L0G8E0_9EUKA|nr:hypothetical protein SARC_02665 [Sphaeroforma arctica JP610]KNC85141.1 hypothetical protein SARC_02665 [Sphaeroforma arctica JP610]|eukprot:XP_014159043.1 hypothetical protein SARC_02665 [Sphaeroforma arctica JP610]
MVVPQSSLAQLVRATAIRAGRVMRETAASYKSFYKQREEYLSDIVAKYKVQSQFEEFMETVIQPRESDDVT